MADAKEEHSHFPEYVAEFVGTAALVFIGLSAVVFDFGAGLPMSQWVPDTSMRLLITGLSFAGTGSLIAVSPLGRLSGGHINPSVSLAFWLHGTMKFRDFLCYVVAQMLGGIVGAFLLAGLWTRFAGSVKDGMTLPGAGFSLETAFGWEVALTGTMVFLILFFVSSRRLMRWTPLMNWIVIATMVWQEAPVSGTSLNPARSFGPALMSGIWRDQWIYMLAPPLGAIVGLAIFNLCTPSYRCALTGKLFSALNYRSIFKGALDEKTRLPGMEQSTSLVSKDNI